MVDIFLTAKHWQLSLLVSVAFGSGMYLDWNEALPILLEILTLLIALVLSGWVIAVGVECNKRTAPELRSSPRLMLVGVAYAMCYLLFISAFDILGMGSLEPRYKTIFLIFHLLATACIFYSMIYTAKRFLTLQRGHKVAFLEYSGLFLDILFFPVGIWFMQPKVNELLGSQND